MAQARAHLFARAIATQDRAAFRMVAALDEADRRALADFVREWISNAQPVCDACSGSIMLWQSR